MLPILDNDQMREADRHTIEDLGVPGLVLMENAATGVVDCVRDRFPEATSVLILCGRGNNGGDGLAMARHLHCGGHDVRVMIFGDKNALSPDATTNLKIAANFGVPIIDQADAKALGQQLAEKRPDFVVDALLGTGLDRALGGRLAEVAEMLNSDDVPIVAVDVPTGLNGSSSEAPGLVLEADITVTFGSLKLCHVLPPASEYCGEVAIVDIGIPPEALEAGSPIHLIESFDIALLLPERDTTAHKGHFGHLLIVAGATGRAGAVAMAARAGVVCGSGLVTMAVPEAVVPVVDLACLEAMTHPLKSTKNGEIASAEGLEDLLERISALAIGPGMGTGAPAARTLDKLLDTFEGSIVLDADAINLLAGRPEKLEGRKQIPVLTPHPAELARLLGKTTQEVVENRLDSAREAAKRAGSVIVAKGYKTIIASPDGDVWVNATGDAHLASGGSGDVLTGAIGAFLAQGHDPVRAALLACWLHGRAGELAAEYYPAAVPASELSSYIAKAWLELDQQA